MIFGDFLKALGQLGDRRFLKVVGLGVLLSLALLFGVYVLQADLILLREACRLLLGRLRRVLEALATFARTHAEVPTLIYVGQPRGFRIENTAEGTP